MDYKNRKNIRLTEYDYNSPGYYFLTVCTSGRKPILCTINPIPNSTEISCKLTPIGEIIQKQLKEMSGFYSYARIDKYIIMPNHIHFILQITENAPRNGNFVSSFVGTFKRFCNKSCGENIWQARFYDHVIRNEKEHLDIWNYIDGNPCKWADDDYYCG